MKDWHTMGLGKEIAGTAAALTLVALASMPAAAPERTAAVVSWGVAEVFDESAAAHHHEEAVWTDALDSDLRAGLGVVAIVAAGGAAGSIWHRWKHYLNPPDHPRLRD